ncbi:MAG TPA: CaiB/BaiF CoA-transferase family protein [Pseudorhodoplanes sp.]|nr:CaiB/BaiF CoA-transferase family protein [Pseudorhodoplanes sp.]
MQPLAGLLVVDLTTLLPGPLATLMLAEAGAEVIKVEKPGGEDMRRFEPSLGCDGAAFALLNRGKRTIVLDLKADSGRERLKSLLQRADILVEQFRPGVMDRLGFGFDAARAINPRLIYCSISGYGQSGPRAQEAGHDINYIGNTGLLGLQASPPGQPVVPPALIADIGGGTFPAVINILLALRERDRTGEGCHLDIAMTDAMFVFAWHALAQGAATGAYPRSGEGLLTGGSPRYQLYPARDGKLIACGALEDHFWRRFTQVIGLDAALADDDADPKATRAAVARIIASRTAEEWRPVFAQADCCATIVASLEEAMRDPHFAGRGLFARKVHVASGETMPALPVPVAPRFRGDPGEARAAPPLDSRQSTVRDNQ